MTDERKAGDDRIYMVSGEDGNGDTHVFVTRSLDRAEQRRQGMASKYRNLKADWVE